MCVNCVFVCMLACIYIYIYLFIYLFIFIFIFMFIFIFISIFRCIFIYTYTCARAHLKCKYITHHLEELHVYYVKTYGIIEYDITNALYVRV